MKQVDNKYMGKGDFSRNSYDIKYDVAVVGFGWAHNYGAVLTNYGMMKYLQKIGLNPLMVEKPLDMNNNCYYDIIYTDMFARRFNQRHFPNNISRIYDDENDMRSLNGLVDTFILGSDQTLNYTLHKSAQYYIGMGFANNDKKKIAYSAGMGHYEYMGDEMDNANMRYYLSKYDSIAVREPNTVNLLKEQFDVDAVNVVDPMYFISAEEYNSLAKLSTEKLYDNCIVAFLLIPNPDYWEQLNILSKKLNCEVVIISQFWEIDKFKKYGFKTVISPEVEGWINHIKSARFVVTDSFHAVYTIITLEKPFLFVINNNTTHKRGMARFPIFTSIPELEKRFLWSIEDIGKFKGLDDEIDYKKVHKIFDKQKDFSIKWLEDALNKPKTNKTTEYIKSLDVLHEKLDIIYNKMEKLSEISGEKINSENNLLNYIKYYKYKLLSKVTFGKIRQYYKGKKKNLKNKLK